MAELTQDLLEPKEIEVDGKKYIISKFPAFTGREIILQYSKIHLLNSNDSDKMKEIVVKLMNFVAVTLPDGRLIRLSTEALIDNHVPSWETLVKLEAQMMTYNCSFFQNGEGLNFLKRLETFAQEKVIGMLTLLSENLLQKNKQHSGNSSTDTH